MEDGGWEMEDGRWGMGDGDWEMEDGGWGMADEGWRMEDLHPEQSHCWRPDCPIQSPEDVCYSTSKLTRVQCCVVHKCILQ